MFLFTVDEGDYYDGGPPLNPGCNGYQTPCQYDTAEAGGAVYGTPGFVRNEGEIDANLASAYRQLDAPFGEFGMGTLNADTSALASNSPSDATYTGMDAQLQACNNARAPLVAQIQGVLQAAETGERPVDPRQAGRLVKQADQLIQDASQLAGDSTPPTSTICS